MVKMGRSLKGSLNTKAKLNESQAEEIRALRNKGAGTIELCEKYNVCASTIRYIIANVRYSDNQYKPQIKKNKERISKETVDKIFEMYKNGSKISEISQSLSIDRSTISKWVNGRNSLKL
jgi:DNA invertase Pin-like site-specific DNA recombinase